VTWLVLATVFQSVTSFIVTRLMLVSSNRMVNDLRKRAYAHVLRLPVAYYDLNKTGAIMSRVMNDAEGIRNLIGGGLLDFAGAVLTSIFALVVLIRISPMITLFVFSALVIFGAVLKWGAGKYNPYFRQQNEIRAEVNGRLMEALGGIRVIKTYQAEKQEINAVSRGLDNLLSKMLTTSVSAAALSMAVAAVTGVMGAAVMYFGARQVMAARLTLGELFQYTMFLAVLVAPLIQIVSVGTRLGEATAGIERIRQLLEEKREEDNEKSTEKLDDVNGEVRFDHVSFAYEQGDQTLHDVSLHARPGTVTALVGPSGGGKSTIIGLLAGFYQATEGTIWIDDTDLSRVQMASFRGHLGAVLQDTFLFDGSIRENVALGRPDATGDEIHEACRIAHIDEFVARMKQGLDTIVGERGVRLSAGQRQRISIARAIVANPKILILDEATSNLDFESEAIIQDALSALIRNRTTFVVAHRLSTVRRAGQILVIENGRIAERGDHESLYQAQGRYWELYQKQHRLDSNLLLAPDERLAQAEEQGLKAADTRVEMEA
jgi:subfamily B ATP-binding cassette protein MsbA